MDLISIVIPVVKRVNRLLLQCKQLENLAAENHEYDFEFLFVDDGSHSESISKITEITQKDKRFRLVVLTRNFGETAAFIAGAAYASGDCVGFFRGNNFDPELVISDLIEYWHAGAKIVLGRSVDPGSPTGKTRGLLSTDTKFLRRMFPERNFQDISSLFIDKEVYYLFSQISNPHSGLLEILAWTGINPVLVEYKLQVDEGNEKQYVLTHRSISLNYADGVSPASSLRTLTVLGLILSLMGVIITASLIIENQYYSVNFQDWWILTGAVFILMGVEFILMGVFGEQIVRSVEKIRSRPTYVVDTVINPPISSSEHGREKIEKMILSLWNVRKQKNIYSSVQHFQDEDIGDQD